MDNKCQEKFDLEDYWFKFCASLNLRVGRLGNQLVNCLLGLARLHTYWCVLHLLTPVAGVWLGGRAVVEVLLGPVQVAGLVIGWRRD